MPEAHKIILSQLLSHIPKLQIMNVLDAGSGITSFGIILSCLKNISVDAVVYPGDLRKINSIRNTIPKELNYHLIER